MLLTPDLSCPFTNKGFALTYFLKFWGTFSNFNIMFLECSVSDYYKIKCNKSNFIATMQPEERFWNTVQLTRLLDLGHTSIYL